MQQDLEVKEAENKALLNTNTVIGLRNVRVSLYIYTKLSLTRAYVFLFVYTVHNGDNQNIDYENVLNFNMSTKY